MKPLVLLKWLFLLGSLGVVLLLPPTCKAQSEIAPDHFDGPNTEPLEKPKTFAAAETNKTNHTPTSNQKAVAAKGQSRKPNPNQSAQLVATRELSHPAEKSAVAVQAESKPAPRKPKDE